MILKRKHVIGIMAILFIFISLLLSSMEVYGQESDHRTFYDTCSERDFWHMHQQDNPYGISSYMLGETIDETGLFRSNLDGPALELYDCIAQAGVSFQNNIVKMSIPLWEGETAEEVFEFYKSIYPKAMWSYEYDHLDQFYWNDLNGVELKGAVSYNENGEILDLEFMYIKSAFYTSDVYLRAKEKLSLGVSGAKKYTKRLDQLVFLNQWVCNNCSYDYAGLQAENYTKSAYFAHSMVGLLVNGKGVCEAYAKTVKLLCQNLGIPCVFVVSDSHAFNYVKIDGNWYMIDCTFNDSGDNPDHYRDYFLISNRPAIDRVHLESDVFTYPKTSDKPYVKKIQNLIVRDANGNEISSLKMNAGKTKSLSVSGANTRVRYISRDTSIATISTSGVIKAIKPGIVKIQILAEEDATYQAASKTITVTVRPGATTKVTLSNLSKGIKISWEKVPYATGYYVYRGTKLVAKIASGNTTSYKNLITLTNGRKYIYKVYAYADTGKSTAYKSAVIYRLSKPTISTLTNSGTSKMTVKYSKNSKASGYKIQYSRSSSFSTKKTITVTSYMTVSKTIRSLTKGKRYYVRVRSYKTVNGVKYYSAWSDKKSVRIIK